MILATLLLAGASGVTVTLPMEATSQGTELTLGEIAEVRGDDAAEVALVQALDLGNTPSPGHTRLMHAHRIREEMSRELPGVAVRFVGQTACRVRPDVEIVSADTVEAAVRRELARVFAGQDATFAPREALQSTSVPRGAVPASIRVQIADPVSTAGIVPVPVQVLVDGAPYRTLWTSWEAIRYATLPVLARPVRAGETIQPYHLTARRVPVKEGRAKALPASMLSGAVAAHDLTAGEPVTEADVHRPIAVQLGDTVTLEVRKGAVVARTSGTALGNGSIGDRVRVRADLGGQDHNAVVISRDLVRIDLGR